MLRLVLPKGSLESATFALFDAADLTVKRSSQVDYRASIADPRINEVRILRPQEIPVYVQAEIELPAEPPLFAGISEEVLLSYGVPPEWLDDVRKATESTLLDLAGHLPQEAAEAIAGKKIDAVAFGKPFLANPDLPARVKVSAALNAPDEATFYTPGAKGYTDYPAMA
jgi:hypothetical protein